MKHSALRLILIASLALAIMPARAATVDSDGDGFSDELESGFGSNPNNATSTPFNGQPAGTPQSINVTNLGIMLDFANVSKDQLTLRGTFTVPFDYNPFGEIAVVNVGGIVKTFTLGTDGQANLGSAMFGITTPINSGTPGGETATFAMTLKDDFFLPKLTDEGLTNSTVNAKPVQVDIEIALVTIKILYKKTQSDTYSAKAGVSGLFGTLAKSGGGGGKAPSVDITNFAAEPNPAINGQPVTFSGAFTASKGTLTASLDFGDGSNSPVADPVAATLKKGIAHVYQTEGVYVAQLSVSVSGASATTMLFVTVGENAVVNPLNGMISSATIDATGTVTLQLNISRIANAVNAVTEFEDTLGRAAPVSGLTVTRKFDTPGVAVATSTAVDKDGNPLGKARKTLAIGAAAVGDSGALPAAPDKHVKVKKLGGKFNFTLSSSDKVDFSGELALAKGFDPAREGGNSLYIAIGNIADSVIFDAKGKASESMRGRITKARVKYPRLANGTAAGGEIAKLSVSLDLKDMVSAGFDTEGIASALRPDEAHLKAASRTIQIGLVLAGVPYEVLAPVTFAVSRDADFGQISARRTK